MDSKNIGTVIFGGNVNENPSRLADLLMDVFLLEPDEYSLDLSKADVDTWDSLGTVAMAVGIQEEFGYHLSPEEAIGIESVQDIIHILTEEGVEFD